MKRLLSEVSRFHVPIVIEVDEVVPPQQVQLTREVSITHCDKPVIRQSEDTCAGGRMK